VPIERKLSHRSPQLGKGFCGTTSVSALGHLKNASIEGISGEE